MKVARLHGAGDIRISDEPQPVPGPGEELVRIDAVGICGSDLHWFTEGAIGDARLSRPLVLGHEMAGTIASGPRAGMPVAVDPSIPCWVCPPCRAGDPNLCLRVIFAGHGHTDGGMREYLTWPAERLHRVPDDLDPGCDHRSRAARRRRPRHGHVPPADRATVAVVGCGPIGIMLVQLARVAGASHVVAVDPLAHRRALAASFGAVAVAPDEAVATVAELTDGLGVDLAMEVAGTDPGVDLSLTLARPGARVVLVGIPDGDRTTFTASTARRKGLTLVMSRRMREVYPRAVELTVSGRVDLNAVISDRVPLAEAAKAVEMAAQRLGHKVVISA